MSGDILPGQDFIEKITHPLEDKNTGVVACRPVPLTRNKGFLAFLTRFQWKLSHKISLKNPKFGEAIAFKKVFSSIPSTAVDAEYIAKLVKKCGFRGFYQKEAIVYNKGPETIRDYLAQRRRIYSGHLHLLNKGYRVSSMEYSLLVKAFVESIRFRYVLYVMGALFLESAGRFLGFFDYIRGRDHSIWKIAKTTKNLKIQSRT